MKVFYRKITKKDFPKWEQLGRKEFLKEDFCSAEYLMNRWDFIRGWVLLTDLNEWIGCCFISTYHHSFNPKGVHFLETCTFPKFRGKGYGKYIMKLMHDNSVGRIKSACINPQNFASIAMFTKYGFKETGTHKNWKVYICNADYFPSELKNLDLVELKDGSCNN